MFTSPASCSEAVTSASKPRNLLCESVVLRMAVGSFGDKLRNMEGFIDQSLPST